MKIGSYEISSIEAGRFWLDGGALFGVVPWVLWNTKYPPDERYRIEVTTRCLLIRGQKKIILVDTGNGDKWNAKNRDIYKFDFSKHDLLQSLKSNNISPEDVTDVILTHLHFDHAGGATKYINGKLELTFQNARHFVQREQWDWAQHPTEKDHASFRKEDYSLLKECGVLELVDGEIEIYEGIEVLVTNGHTEAQQLVKISDPLQTILFCADLLPFEAHLAYPYIMGFDIRPLETLIDKKRIFTRAYNEKWIMFLEHDPKVLAMTLKRTEKGFSAAQHLTGI